MTRLSLALLGPMQLTLDGQPVGGFAYNKARALLAYLAVEADRPHHRDTLAALLWPELPDEAARHNLRQALTNLRTAIGDASATPPFLLITRDSIQFNPASDYDLDISTFMALLRTCNTHAHRRRESCRSCATRMEQALTLYRGDFLAGFSVGDSVSFEEWQLRQRERLHQHALDALVRLADYFERRGEDELGRRYAQRQIELEPWREEAHRQLMRLLARGGQRSGALAQYETCRRMLARDLGVEPEAETTALYEQIRDGELRIENENLKTTDTERFSIFNSQFSISRHNFPAPTTPLIGRETELAELGSMLENPAHRLITIVGPGGIGKTRLTLAAAAEQAEVFADGATFVPLQAISSAAFLAPAILAALGIGLQGQRDPRDQLLDYLRDKELLLLLDNVEQLLAPNQNENASLVDLLVAILAQAPSVTLLATSRERLALPGEWLYDLAGLSYPVGETNDHIESYDAVRLFVQRAGQVRRQFALAEGEARAVARICRLVEGMPLAIELAAAALRTRSCTALASAIETSLSALTSQLRAVPERQRSMWATFEHSWRLLSEEERQVFARLSVFRGGFDEEAAQVAQASPQLLTTLLDKSLLRWDGAGRYDMHELLRQFVVQKLAQLGEAEQIGEQHLMYYCRLAEQGGYALYGPEQTAWSERLDRELGNLRAALAWSIEHNIELGLRLAGALDRYWSMYRPPQEGISWLEQLLRHPDASTPSLSRARAVLALGWLHYHGFPTAARSLAEEDLALYQALEDDAGVARALFLLGVTINYQEGRAAGVPIVRQSLALARACGDTRSSAEALAWLAGEVYDHNYDYEQARLSYEEALTLFRDLGDVAGLARVLSHMAQVAAWSRDFARAHQWLHEAQALNAELRVIGDVIGLYEMLGVVALNQGQHVTAQAAFEESLALGQASGGGPGAWTLSFLGYSVLGQGDRARAYALFAASVQRFRQGPQTLGVAHALEGVARLAVLQGQPKRAVCLYAWCCALRESLDVGRYPVEQDEVDRDFVTIRGLLDEATFAAAWAEGRTLTLEQAIAEALNR